MSPTESSSAPSGRMRTAIQKLAVRAVASELDRRSATLEKALADTNRQIAAQGAAQEMLSAQIDAANDYVRRVHEHLGNVESAHQRLMNMHTGLVARIDATEAEHHTVRRGLEGLTGEFEGLREAIARLDRIVQLDRIVPQRAEEP